MWSKHEVNCRVINFKSNKSTFLTCMSSLDEESCRVILSVILLITTNSKPLMIEATNIAYCLNLVIEGRSCLV